MADRMSNPFGGTQPTTTQTMQYLFRNAVVSNIEDLVAELKFLQKEEGSREQSQPPDTELADKYIKDAIQSMNSYLDLADKDDLRIARSIAQSPPTTKFPSHIWILQSLMYNDNILVVEWSEYYVFDILIQKSIMLSCFNHINTWISDGFDAKVWLDARELFQYLKTQWNKMGLIRSFHGL